LILPDYLYQELINIVCFYFIFQDTLSLIQIVKVVHMFTLTMQDLTLPVGLHVSIVRVLFDLVERLQHADVSASHSLNGTLFLILFTILNFLISLLFYSIYLIFILLIYIHIYVYMYM
jgi:hypothetical protein